VEVEGGVGGFSPCYTTSLGGLSRAGWAQGPLVRARDKSRAAIRGPVLQGESLVGFYILKVWHSRNGSVEKRGTKKKE